MRAFLLLIPSLALIGCQQKPDGDADDTGTVGTDTAPSTTFDTGCILVDGGGGYAHLQDALSLAVDGSTIELCDGTYEQSATVEKAVTITGSSRDGVVIVGQGLDPALHITAGATIQNLTVQSSYTGIRVAGAVSATLLDITVDSPEYWGVQVLDATETALTNLLIVDAAGGGVQVSGGTATLTGLLIEGAASFGVQAYNGADILLAGSTINDTRMLSEDVTDGFAIHALDATVTTDGNFINGPELADDALGMGIYSEGAVLNLANDVINGAFLLSIFAVDGDINLANMSLTNATTQGAYLVAPSVYVDGITATTSPDASCTLKYSRWWTGDNGPWCGGIFVGADDATIANATVSGWNNYGIYVQGYTEFDKPVAISNTLIQDTGRWGLYLNEEQATVSGLTITGLREPEFATPCEEEPDSGQYQVDRSASLLQVGGSLDISGSTLANNQGWGVSAVQGQVSMTTSVIDTNACAGVLNFGGAVSITGSTFSGSSDVGGIWEYQGATLVEGNHFIDNHYRYTYTSTSVDPYTGATVTYETLYSGYAWDIQSSSSTGLRVIDNIFENGDGSIALWSSDMEATGNTWSSYDAGSWALILAYMAPSGSTVYLGDNTFDDIGGYILYDLYSDVEMEDTTIGTHRALAASYESYTDGVLTSSYTYSGGYVPFVASGYSDYPTSLTIDGLDIVNAPYGIFSTSDSTLDFSDIRATSVAASTGSTMMYSSWSTVDPVADIANVEVETLGGSGIAMYSSTTGDSYVNLSGLGFGSLSGTALQVGYLRNWTVEASDLGSVGSYGVYAYSSSTNVSNVTIRDVTLTGANTDGIYITGGTATITGSNATAGGNGLNVYGASATVTGNAFTGNTSYGMKCSTTTLTTCGDNDLSGNGAGEHSGCDDGCGLPADDGTDGGTDSGS